jgi:hypothetical protein
MKTRLLLFLLLAFSFANAQVTDGLIQEFKFDNSTTNEANTISFTHGSTGGLVSDRFGVANKALGFTNSGASATIPNLPYSNSQRSFSFWAKSNYVGPIYHYFFVYGSNACEAGYGLGLNSSNIINLGVCSNASNPTTSVLEKWYFYTVTYDGTNMKIYINGVLVKTEAIAINTVNYNNLFTLGKDLFNSNPYAVNTFSGAIDDLKIYNRAITESEVSQLYGVEPIAEYTFDNTYNNVNGNTPFNSTPATSFVNNRTGESQKALRINTSSQTVCMATLTTLPTANSSRSVSLWYKNDSFSTGTPAIFIYGANASNQYFGNYINTSGNVVLWSYVTDHNFGGSYTPNVWRHLVMTHDGTNVKLYIDGNYVGQKTTTLNTGNAIGFRIGNTVGAVEYDDLKIFDVALTQSQISSLRANNTLSTSDFSQNNLEVALYPNPVNDVLNIETTLELKSVEIYNLQGQKVLSSNQKAINVSALTSGMYMVRIEDLDNAVSTKKIIVK